MYKSIIAISLILVISACVGVKEVPSFKNQEEGTYILIGQGGGVTGAYEEYVLQWDGLLFIWDENNPREKAKPNGTLSNVETAKIFQAWDNLNVENGVPPKPGNMNYRIIYYSKKESHTVRWSDSENIDAEVQEFYSETFRTLKNAK